MQYNDPPGAVERTNIVRCSGQRLYNARFKLPFPSQRKDGSLELQTAFIAFELRHIAKTPLFTSPACFAYTETALYVKI